MYNKLSIIGHTGSDANVTDKAVRLNVATTYSYKQNEEWVNKTQWHNVVVFGGMMNYAKKVMKGDLVQVEGRFESSTYKNQDGVEKVSFAIIADSMKILTSNSAKQSTQSAPQDDIPFPDQRGDLPF